MDIHKQYDKIGKSYIAEKKNFFSNNDDAATDFIRRSLPDLNDKTVLDLGCGGGDDIKMYESLGAKNIYGIDASETMINEAKQNVSHPENLSCANIEDTKSPNDFFDVVAGRYSLHYLENFDKAYQEIARILKPGGLLIIAAHHPLRDLIFQKEKIYGRKEMLEIKIFDNKITLYFPSHTIMEYLSKTFFKLFNLQSYEEMESPESETVELGTPGILAFTAIKK